MDSSSKHDPDLVTLFAKAGKGIAGVFTPKRSQTSPPNPSGDHEFTFGVVYANEIAAAEIDKPTPRFPVGSILVRERLDSATSTVPAAVIAMVKRPAGFSNATADWEFFTFSGAHMKLLSRQTTGRCAECHSTTQKTDWVFLTQLQK